MTISIYIYEHDLENLIESEPNNTIIVYSIFKLASTQVKINLDIQQYIELNKNKKLRKIEIL
jgi:hypothetical protein